MKFIKTILVLLVLLFGMLVTFQSSTAAFDLFGDSCTGQAANSPTCQQKNSQGGDSTNRVTGNSNVFQVAVNLVALIAGVAAIIMIIISALTMVTSGGNTETVTNSRRRLIAAVIGLAIVALAWTIISFVINRVIK